MYVYIDGWIDRKIELKNYEYHVEEVYLRYLTL